MRHPLWAVLSVLLVCGVSRAEYIEMQGDYIYTAIGENGTMGAGGGTSPGIIHGPSGEGVFNTDYDYLTPGSPWEVFSVSSTETGRLTNNNTSPDSGNFSKVSLSEVADSGYDYYVRWEGTSASMDIIHEYYFNEGQESIYIKSTLTASSDLSSVEFLRAIDPDPDSLLHSISATENGRGLDANGDGDFDDEGDVSPEDWVHSVGQESGYTIGLYTTSETTHNVAVENWSKDPCDYLDGSEDTVADDTIGVAFDIGTLLSGEAIVLEYLYVLGGSLETASFGDESFDFVAPALNDNQTKLGTALQSIAGSGGSTITTEVQALGSDAAVRSAYNQLSGQSRPSTMPVTMDGTTQFMGLASQRLRTAGGVSSSFSTMPLLAAATEITGPDDNMTDVSTSTRSLFALGRATPYYSDRRWGFWGKGFGVWGDKESEGTVSGYNYSTGGSSFGLDYMFNKNFTAGLMGGYSNSSIHYGGTGSDETDIDAVYGGLYAGYETNRWYVDNVATYTNLDYETDRFVTFGSVDEHLEGSYNGYQIANYLEGGLNVYMRDVLVQPFAAFEFSYLKQEDYSEKGGSSALSYDDQSYESYKASLGLKLSRYLYREDDRYVTGQIRGRWIHEFGDAQPEVSASFASNPGSSFIVSDENIARDSASFGMGVNAQWFGQSRFYVDYDVLLNTDTISHALSAGLRYTW